MLDVQALKGHVARLKDFCLQDPGMPIIQAVEKLMGTKKQSIAKCPKSLEAGACLGLHLLLATG